jgi:uncharacterized membrane-anchored protein
VIEPNRGVSVTVTTHRGAPTVLAIATKSRWAPNVLIFWLAFVPTRPLGATVGSAMRERNRPAVLLGAG